MMTLSEQTPSRTSKKRKMIGALAFPAVGMLFLSACSFSVDVGDDSEVPAESATYSFSESDFSDGSWCDTDNTSVIKDKFEDFDTVEVTVPSPVSGENSISYNCRYLAQGAVIDGYYQPIENPDYWLQLVAAIAFVDSPEGAACLNENEVSQNLADAANWDEVAISTDVQLIPGSGDGEPVTEVHFCGVISGVSFISILGLPGDPTDDEIVDNVQPIMEYAEKTLEPYRD